MINKHYDKSIYTKDSIVRAVSDYADLCLIYITEDDRFYNCTFSNCKYDEEETVSEFGNYVIDLMNSDYADN